MIVTDINELIGDVAAHMAEDETGYNILIDGDAFGADPFKTKERDQWLARARAALGFLREADQLRAFFPTQES